MRLIYLLICLCLISCKSYTEFSHNDNTCHYENSMFIINKDNKTLHDSVFNIIKKNHRIEYNKKYIKEKIWSLGDNQISYVTTLKNLMINRIIRYKNREISKVRFMYEDGNTYIGKETYFDEQGNITKVIDHEKGYKICWAEIIAIMKKRYRSLIRKYEIHSFYLSRVSLNDFPEAKPRWTVTMEGNEAYEQKGYDEGQKHYSFDGVTGKYLYTSTSRSVYD